jgi:hypothetical protein
MADAVRNVQWGITARRRGAMAFAATKLARTAAAAAGSTSRVGTALAPAAFRSARWALLSTCCVRRAAQWRLQMLVGTSVRAANAEPIGLRGAERSDGAVEVSRAALLAHRTQVSTDAAAMIVGIGRRCGRTIRRANTLLAAKRVHAAALGRIIRGTGRVNTNACSVDVEQLPEPGLAHLTRGADAARVVGRASDGTVAVRGANAVGGAALAGVDSVRARVRRPADAFLHLY